VGLVNEDLWANYHKADSNKNHNIVSEPATVNTMIRQSVDANTNIKTVFPDLRMNKNTQKLNTP
jgi:hypothetical protein